MDMFLGVSGLPKGSMRCKENPFNEYNSPVQIDERGCSGRESLKQDTKPLLPIVIIYRN